MGGLIFIAVAAFVTLLYLSAFSIKAYERGVVLRFGIFKGVRQPGLNFIVPFVDELIRVDQRVITMDIPPQDIITRDNVSIKVNAVLYFRVVDPSQAVLTVENFLYATSQIAQTTLRSVCGEAELDDLLAKREQINMRVQEILDRHTDPWGIKVSTVEVKDIDLPQEMRRAMARQAEAERERRAKIIQAEGEFQAAEKLTAAAGIMSKENMSLQLRYLETLKQISSENNSTILFPMPIDFLKAFCRE
ncbi:MAG: slipin family protein [Pseudomonadota bacterium]|jgi:regulator of protease activity HflC (stomatin/prohibitin superfamily)